MFDFFKEVIINSAKCEGLDRFKFMTDRFRVLRCADYLKSGLYEGKVYHTAPREGVCAEVAFDLSACAADKQYRILMDVSLENRYYSDYAMPWSRFHKYVMVEFMGGTDAVANAKKALNAAIPADYKYVVVADGDALVVKCSEPYQVVKSALVQEMQESACYNGCSDSEFVTVAEGTITPNVAPFATGEWLTENLRFPTYPNLRYAALNEDERPVPGAKYHMYSFEYTTPRRGMSGQGAVGQMLPSLTHHVFYVLDGAVNDAFNVEIAKLGTIEEVA